MADELPFDKCTDLSVHRMVPLTGLGGFTNPPTFPGVCVWGGTAPTPGGLQGSGTGRGGRAGFAEILTTSGAERPLCPSLGRSHRQLFQKGPFAWGLGWVPGGQSCRPCLQAGEAPPRALQQTAARQAWLGGPWGPQAQLSCPSLQGNLAGGLLICKRHSAMRRNRLRASGPAPRSSGNQEVPDRTQACDCARDECQERRGATSSVSSPPPPPWNRWQL